jgi:hypothetical protein
LPAKLASPAAEFHRLKPRNLSSEKSTLFPDLIPRCIELQLKEGRKEGRSSNLTWVPRIVSRIKVQAIRSRDENDFLTSVTSHRNNRNQNKEPQISGRIICGSSHTALKPLPTFKSNSGRAVRIRKRKDTKRTQQFLSHSYLIEYEGFPLA